MSDAPTTVLGWHWMPADRRLRFGDRALVEPGTTLEVSGQLVLCQHGLHASLRALDSLSYLYGPVLSRVELSGVISRGDDKVCAERRTHLWMAEPERTTRALDEWFYWVTGRILMRRKDCGLEVLDQEWTALKTIAAWLDGTETADEVGRAARAARAAGAAGAAWDAWAARAAGAAWAAWAAGAAGAAGAAFSKEANDELERRLLALAPVAKPKRQRAAKKVKPDA